MDKKVVETRYVHDSWGITICCGRLLRGGVDWNANQHHWKHPYLVASFAEAWIEIVCQPYNYLVRLLSPPSRRRGLKLLSGCLPRIGPWVASFAEAWIEILLSSSRLCRCIPSPPSRRRGLKYSVTPEKLLTVVASFAEAWIEISGVDSPFKGMKCRLLRGGVDWNKEDGEPMFTLTGSPPSRRRGLKFKRFANLYTVFLVASFAEAWIEMYSTTLNGFCSSNVASFAEAWIEICTVGCVAIHLVSPPSRRRGLKLQND